MSAPGNADRLSAALWWTLVGLTLAWGFNWTAMKVALSEVAPFTFRSMCLGAGSAVLFAVMRASGQSLEVPRGQRLRLVLLALISVTGWNILVAYGLTMIPSGRAAILAYTMPAWAIPLSVWLLGERMTAQKVVGFALGMAGIVLLLAERAVDLQAAPVGSLLVLCAAVTWAFSTVLIKRYPVNMPAGPYTAWIMLLGGVPIFVCALLIDDFGALAQVSPKAWGGVAYNVLVAFAFAHWAWIKLTTSLSVTLFSLSMLLTPLLGVFSGMLFLGETPSVIEYSALALVLGSLLAVMLPGRRF